MGNVLLFEPYLLTYNHNFVALKFVSSRKHLSLATIGISKRFYGKRLVFKIFFNILEREVRMQFECDFFF